MVDNKLTALSIRPGERKDKMGRGREREGAEIRESSRYWL